MMYELVSIVVPAYNSQGTIARCMESLLAQSYPNIEIIAINDGSTDSTAYVLKQYCNRIQIINQENRGVSFARNRGMRNASGKYVVFVDSDDYVSEDYVEELVRNRKGGALVIGSHVMLENGKKVIPKYIEPFEAKMQREFSEKIRDLLHSCMLQGPYCKLFEKKVLEKNNITFDESMCFGEDFKFVLKYLDVAKQIIYIGKDIYVYCKQRNGLTAVINKNRVDSFLRLSRFFGEYIKKRGFGGSVVEKFYIENILKDYVNLNRINFSHFTKEQKEIYYELRESDIVRDAKKMNIRVSGLDAVFLRLDKLLFWYIFGVVKRVKDKLKER